MKRIDSYPGRSSDTRALPPMLPKVPPGEKHLDAMLLALVQRRKLDAGVLPGVPFH
jgi:hypothetical protein